MHIEIIAVGQKMPDWVNRGYADYADRLTGDLTLGLTEIPLQKRGSASQLAAAQNKEAAQIRTALQTSDHIVTLDIPGREHSSESLAARLQHIRTALDQLRPREDDPDLQHSILWQQLLMITRTLEPCYQALAQA